MSDTAFVLGMAAIVAFGLGVPAYVRYKDARDEARHWHNFVNSPLRCFRIGCSKRRVHRRLEAERNRGMTDHAPQPPPRETDEQNELIQRQAIVALESDRTLRIAALEAKITRQREDLRKEKELREIAEKGRRQSMEVNAALRERLAEAQARLAMAVEALKQWAPPEFRICYRCKGVGTVATDTRGRPIPLAPCNYCDGSGVNSNPRLLKTCDALAATAEAVAAFRQRVKAEGAAEELTKAAEDAKRHRSECMYYGELEARAEELRRKR